MTPRPDSRHPTSVHDNFLVVGSAFYRRRMQPFKYCFASGAQLTRGMNTHHSDYKLRPATSHDHDAIAEIWLSSASLPGVGPPVMPTVEELRRRVGEESVAGWKVTVAEQNGTIVGFAAIKPSEAILDQLFVQPSLIGSGLGRALFKDCQEQMPVGFTLHTASSNEKARRFYENAGMQVLRQDTHPRTDHPVTYYVWNARV